MCIFVSVDVLLGLHRLGLHRQVTIPRFHAARIGLSVNESPLAKMIAGSKPYPRNEATYARATEGLAVPLRHIAFAL